MKVLLLPKKAEKGDYLSSCIGKILNEDSNLSITAPTSNGRSKGDQFNLIKNTE